MKKIFTAGSVVIIILLSCSCYAAQVSDFRFLAHIQMGKEAATPVCVRITPEVFSHSLNNGADIRVFDERGIETPYVLYKLSAPSPSKITWKITGYSNTDGVQTIFLERGDDAGFVKDLTIMTSARDFNKSIEIFAPSDDNEWKLIALDSIYDFLPQVNLKKTTVSFPDVVYRKLKVILRDVNPDSVDRGPAVSIHYRDFDFAVEGRTRGEIPVHGITSRLYREAAAGLQFDEHRVASPGSVLDKEGSTVIEMGRVSLPVERIALSTENSYFFRRAEIWVSNTGEKGSYTLQAQGEIYRIPGIKDVKESLDIRCIRPAYLQLKVINGDNPPLKVSSVTLSWRPRYLYFIPEPNRTYALCIGSETVSSPQYEMGRLIPDVYEKLVGYEKRNIGPVRENGTFNKRSGTGARILIGDYAFKSVVIVLVILLGIWMFHLLRNGSGNRPSRMEP